MKTFDAKIIIEGAIFDAQRFIKEGNTKKAHEVLLRKMFEISEMESSTYVKVRF